MSERERYLAELAAELPVGRRRCAAIMDEVDDHLREAQAAEERAGAEPARAAALAGRAVRLAA